MGKKRVFAALLALAVTVGSLVLPARAAFTDTTGHWAETAITKWSEEYSIINGYEDGTFRPDAPITREQMAKLVAFYVERMGYTLHDAEDTSTIPETFADADCISDYAVESVETLRRTGILNGSQNADGTVSFQPTQTATRAECAAVFYRLANNVTASLVRPAAPTAMDFANESVTLRIPHDASRQLVLACAPREASAYRLVWKSSKPDVATVDQNGLVTAKAVGTTTVSVYSSNGLSASCTVTCVSADLPSAGETYEELGKAMGVDEAAFAETMKTWNGYVEAKNDPDFGRTSFANKLDTAPYYAIKVTAGVHHTMGGLTINTNTEVLKADGTVIPGLFAAGEVTGGVHGANRLGGNAVADFTVFGRIAGKAASDYAA